MEPTSVTIDKPFLVVHIDNRRWYYNSKTWTEQRAIAHVKQSLDAEPVVSEKKAKKTKKQEPHLINDQGIFN